MLAVVATTGCNRYQRSPVRRACKTPGNWVSFFSRTTYIYSFYTSIYTITIQFSITHDIDHSALLSLQMPLNLKPDDDAPYLPRMHYPSLAIGRVTVFITNSDWPQIKPCHPKS